MLPEVAAEVARQLGKELLGDSSGPNRWERFNAIESAIEQVRDKAAHSGPCPTCHGDGQVTGVVQFAPMTEEDKKANAQRLIWYSVAEAVEQLRNCRYVFGKLDGNELHVLPQDSDTYVTWELYRVPANTHVNPEKTSSP